jgi:hypothetical protein
MISVHDIIKHEAGLHLQEAVKLILSIAPEGNYDQAVAIKDNDEVIGVLVVGKSCEGLLEKIKQYSVEQQLINLERYDFKENLTDSSHETIGKNDKK